MIKSTKHILFLAVVIPMVLLGCNDLFDKGDTEKAYDGPDVVGFYPLEAEVDEGSSISIEVQFISSNGLASSDVSVNYSVSGDAETTHYSIQSSSPVTVSQGEATAEVIIDFPEDSGLDEGDEVQLVLTLDGGDAEAGEEIKTSTIYIQGVDDTP